MIANIKRYFWSLWWDIKDTPEYVVDFIRARDSYHWMELKHIIYTFRRDLLHPIWCIKIGVKNLVRWFNVIWFDRDYDYSYITMVMEKKIKFMEEAFIPENTHCSSSKHVRKQLAYARKLLNYTLDYPTPNLDAFYEKCGHIEFEHKACNFDSLGKPMAYEMISNRSEVYNEAWKEAHKKDMEIEKMIDAHVWKFVGKKIKYWWD